MQALLLNGRMGDVAGNMMRGGHGGGFFLGGLMSALWTVLLVLAVLWAVKNWPSIKEWLSGAVNKASSAFQASSAPVNSAQTPLEILQTRYAKGEITREQYEAIRRDLVGDVIPVQAMPVTEA